MKFVITVAIALDAASEQEAEKHLGDTLDLLANGGDAIRGHELLETREVKDDE